MPAPERQRSDIAIVGAGVSGLSIAWHLARANAGSITIYDGSGVGAGASAIQPGGVRQQWATALTCAMAREAYRFYEEVDTILEPVVAPSLDRCGYLFTAESDSELALLRERVAIQREVGVPSELLTASEAGALVPGLHTESLVGASYCREDGYFARPQAVIAAFARSAREMGVSVVTERVLEISPDGGGWQLTLAKGSAALADHVVVAAAHETAPLLAPLGVELPITKEARYLFYSNPIQERLLEPLVMSSRRHFAAKQLADGSVLASDLSAIGDPEEDKAGWYTNVRRTISELLPILEYVTFPVMVEGCYDVTPDAHPVLGPIDSHPGLWVAAGLNGRGFMMAPVVGRFIAESICSAAVEDPLAVLRPSRFATGALIPEGQVV